MSATIKPCPFCGGVASMSKSYDPDTSGAFHYIECHRCRSKGTEFYANETCPVFYAQVRDAWNIRADLVPQWQPIDDETPKHETVRLWSSKFKKAIDGRWGGYCKFNQPEITHWMHHPEAPTT